MPPSPPRLSLAYLAFGHVLLAVAAGLVAWDPSTVVGFFYHPKMIAVVHALTLGWISSSLIAGFYAAAPRTLRTTFAPRRWDVAACVGWCLGTSGLASHFWIEEWSGMGWSAGLTLAVVVFLTVRFVGPVPLSSLPAALKAAYGIAWLNFAATALVGLLIGLDKELSLLPGYSLHNVFAHAHLAAAGWVLPACAALAAGDAVAGGRAARPGRLLAPGIAAVQLGAVGLFVSLLTDSPALAAFAVVGWVGSALLLASTLTASTGGGSGSRLATWAGAVAVVAAGGVGLYLTGGETPAGQPQVILLYGTLVLLGLGLLVAARGMRSRGLAPATVATGWIAAGAMLAWGLYAAQPFPVRAGAATLFAALTLSGLSGLVRLKRGGCTRSRSACG